MASSGGAEKTLAVGKPMLRPRFSPWGDQTLNAVGPAQQLRRPGEFTVGEGITHPAAADAASIDFEGDAARNTESLLLSGLLQCHEGAAGTVTKVKVLADHHVAHVERLDQHIVDKRLR